MFKFRKKIKEEVKVIYPQTPAEFFEKEKNKKDVTYGEPETLASIRLRGKAKDKGFKKGIKLYNEHRVKLQNQWVNAAQSINSGYGTSQNSSYNYEVVNYWECAVLSQDPLMNKILNLLSESPFSKGGEIILNKYEEKIDEVNKHLVSTKIFSILTDIVKTSFRDGGCQVLMDFGQKDFEKPLDLKTVNPKNFKGFRKIDPLYCQAVDVNTVNPTTSDFMKPKKWYIVGLGTCDSSHFIHFVQNVPANILKPMCLYFGFPLTALIKADVANTTLVSQGIANLINRFRYLFLTTSSANFTTDNAQAFKDRLELMNTVQDNFNYAPLKDDEKVEQLIAPLGNVKENLEFFFQIVSAKVGIPFTELMGISARGLSATGEGDRISWYDKQQSIRQSVKDNLILMLNIELNKFFGENINCVDDYLFNALEELNRKEETEVLKTKMESVNALDNFGYKRDSIDNWLKSDKRLNLNNLELDTETEGLEDYEDDGEKGEVAKSEE